MKSSENLRERVGLRIVAKFAGIRSENIQSSELLTLDFD